MILQLMLWFGIPCMSFIYIIARILVGNCFLRLEESARIWGKKMLEKFFFFSFFWLCMQYLPDGNCYELMVKRSEMQ
jgi:ABC-type transport system involved in cytochrome c biogenesis permease subunit